LNKIARQAISSNRTNLFDIDQKEKYGNAYMRIYACLKGLN